jgi:hypothetical protein
MSNYGGTRDDEEEEEEARVASGNGGATSLGEKFMTYFICISHLCEIPQMA